MAKIIIQIYQIHPSALKNAKTIYHVGIVSGCTSVNTIAQNAMMLCEYHSAGWLCLQHIKEQFQNIFDANQTDTVKLKIRVVGENPPEHRAKKVKALMTN